MHVFLTGERGIGKSWAIQRAVTLLGRTPYGFLTRFQTGQDGTASLHMISPSGEERMNEENRIALRREGRMVLLPERFDILSTGLLQAAGLHPEGVILMDECGYLEAESDQFHREILRCLDGDIPVLGVLRMHQPWHAFIKNHPRVRVFSVTLENRDALPRKVAETLLMER